MFSEPSPTTDNRDRLHFDNCATPSWSNTRCNSQFITVSVYVNDIVDASTKCNINLFADDTSAYVSSPTKFGSKIKLQSAVDTLWHWFHRWHLSVSTTKTVCMAILLKMPHCQLDITDNNTNIPQVPNIVIWALRSQTLYPGKNTCGLSSTRLRRKLVFSTAFDAPSHQRVRSFVA